MTAHFERTTILMIEDDPGHQRLVEINLCRANVTNPIVVLKDAQSVTRCYELECNIFITKPIDYQQFRKVIHKLGSLLSCVTLSNGD